MVISSSLDDCYRKHGMPEAPLAGGGARARKRGLDKYINGRFLSWPLRSLVGFLYFTLSSTYFATHACIRHIILEVHAAQTTHVCIPFIYFDGTASGTAFLTLWKHSGTVWHTGGNHSGAHPQKDSPFMRFPRCFPLIAKPVRNWRTAEYRPHRRLVPRA